MKSRHLLLCRSYCPLSSPPLPPAAPGPTDQPARLPAAGSHDALCRRHHLGQYGHGRHPARRASTMSVSTMQTSGVVNAFWQSEIQATSSGKLGAKNFTPALYDSFDTGHAGKKQEVSLTYDSGNPPRLYADPAYSTTGYEVKPDDQKNTLDPLSAVTVHLQRRGRRREQSLRRDRAGVRRPPPLQHRNDQGEGHRHQDGQWPVHRQGLQCQVELSPARRLQAAGAARPMKAFPLINAWIATFPSQVAGPDLCGAAAGLGGYQIWRAGDGRQFPQGGWREPQGHTLTDTKVGIQTARSNRNKSAAIRPPGCSGYGISSPGSQTKPKPAIKHKMWWFTWLGIMLNV